MVKHIKWYLWAYIEKEVSSDHQPYLTISVFVFADSCHISK